MIWVSNQLMTAIDLLVLAVGVYVGFRIYKNRKRTPILGNSVSVGLIAAGLLIFIVFFAADLYVMWVMPRLVGTKAAISAMENLHLNISWFMVPLAVCTIAIGLLRVNETLDTALKRIVESEEKYRLLIDLSPDAILVQQDGKIVFASSSAATLFRADGTEQLIGKETVELVHPEDRREMLERRESLRRGGKLEVSAELRRLRLDGTTFYGESLGAYIPWYGEEATLIVIRDITERQALQEQLIQAQKMEVIGQLTGGVAHDFNNLLTVILGNIELLQDHVVNDPAAQELIDTALKASGRGADLTYRLLAYSRQQTLSPEITDVNRLISDSTELMRRTLGEDIEIEAALAGGVWQAMVDPKQLENAVLNLALNARDAMPGGGKLTIETANAHLDQEYADTRDEVRHGQYVLIAVSDTGTGMPPEVVDQAFDPFFTTKEVGEGSGLGLSMVYGFAKQSGGHAAIYSEVGHGTTVKLYLPRVMGAEGAIRDEKRRKMPLRKGDEILLVVEDDVDVRAFITRALRSVGYGVIDAADGKAALLLVDETPDIDLLVTDVVLPHGMNGRELADRVRKRRPTVKVLFTSGYAENAIIHQGKLDEGVELLMKPYTREMLARRVRSVLDATED